MHKTIVQLMLQQLLLLLLLNEVIIVVTSAAADRVQVTRFRKPRKTVNGPAMCALDKANKTIISSSLQQCSLDCVHDASCAAFNIKNPKTCHLYNYVPRFFALVSNCENYQVAVYYLLRN